MSLILTFGDGGDGDSESVVTVREGDGDFTCVPLMPQDGDFW